MSKLRDVNAPIAVRSALFVIRSVQLVNLVQRSGG
jgi:hypothetical protein